MTAVLCGFASVLISDLLADATPAELILVTLVAGGALLLWGSFRLVKRDWFHPSAFPLIYLAFVLTLPLVYVVLFDQQIERVTASDVSPTLVVVFALTLLGVAGGIVPGLRLARDRTATRPRAIDYDRMRALGRVALVLAVALRAYDVYRSSGQVYGYGSVNFGLDSTITTTGDFLFFGGIILVIVGNAMRRSQIATPTDAVLAAAFVVPTLVSGSRGELIAPALFALWARHTYVRPIAVSRAAAFSIATVLIFQGVAGVRAGDEFFAGADQAIERSVTSIGTPVGITSTLLERVPSSEPYRHGGTYLAAVERQLPGALSVALLGPPVDTASFRYREIIGFASPNAGFGFSLPSEGYLNFGVPGVLFAALGVGWLLGFAYRRVASPPTRALNLLYPILIATLPLSFRGDALLQIKTVLYPMMLLFVAYKVCGQSGDKTYRRALSSAPQPL